MENSDIEIVWHPSKVTRDKRWKVSGGSGATLLFTGLSASGKSTLAALIEEELVKRSRLCYFLDGDNLRHGLNAGLGFSMTDRSENVRRVGEVARLFSDAGLVALVSLVSPLKRDREHMKEIHREADLNFYEIYVDTSLEVCMERDPKGMYEKALRGEIVDFTGISSPYEPPLDPVLRITLETHDDLKIAVNEVLALLEESN